MWWVARRWWDSTLSTWAFCPTILANGDCTFIISDGLCADAKGVCRWEEKILDALDRQYVLLASEQLVMREEEGGGGGKRGSNERREKERDKKREVQRERKSKTEEKDRCAFSLCVPRMF